MPNFFEINNSTENPIEMLNNYIEKLSEKTKRNVIIYYSGWLSVPEELPNGINDLDMNGFMAMTNGLDFDKGLDLILHTPGGDTAATESIINYLHNLFGKNIRAIVPQLAMSGGTMIACSCKEIIMGKQSSLGPIDPQLNGMPGQEILDEFNQAKKEIEENPSCIPLWQIIISKYNPTLITSCQNAIDWSETILRDSLKNYVFEDDNETVNAIVSALNSHNDTKTHNRHLPPSRCKEIGLNITMMEDDDDLQDVILSIHHCCMKIFNTNNIYKIFSNNKRRTYNFEYNI